MDGTEERAAGIATRREPGAFTPPVTVAPRVPFKGDPFFISQMFAWKLDLGVPFGGRGGETLALTGDGHAALSAFLDDDVHGVYQQRARLTTIPSAATAPRPTPSAARSVWPRRWPRSRSPTVRRRWSGANASTGTARAPGRRRCERALGAAPDGAGGRSGQPRRRPRRQARGPVSCSGPCDVRAQALGGSRATGRLRLKHAGRGRLKLDQGRVPVAPRGLGPMRIRLTYAVNGQYPRVRTLTLRLVRPAEARVPRPRIVGLRAERRDDTIRVTVEYDAGRRSGCTW